MLYTNNKKPPPPPKKTKKQNQKTLKKNPHPYLQQNVVFIEPGH